MILHSPSRRTVASVVLTGIMSAGKDGSMIVEAKHNTKKYHFRSVSLLLGLVILVKGV